tara:strand:- start:4911 stop:5483 length:573 start_codon:yes stop_codon:yes gene_type:complete
MTKIAVFISGKGSNASRMLLNFSEREGIEVSLVYSSRPNEDLKTLCQDFGVLYDHRTWNTIEQTNLLQLCKKMNIDWIVLAGFLKLVPKCFIDQFPNKIINIHPSLLPKFGGKGMFGMHVHDAVIKAKEVESGITIHYVNGAYDEGQIIKQFKVLISENETSQSLSTKVRYLEHKYFSDTVAELILSLSN